MRRCSNATLLTRPGLRRARSARRRRRHDSQQRQHAADKDAASTATSASSRSTTSIVARSSLGRRRSRPADTSIGAHRSERHVSAARRRPRRSREESAAARARAHCGRDCQTAQGRGRANNEGAAARQKQIETAMQAKLFAIGRRPNSVRRSSRRTRCRRRASRRRCRANLH